jgi:hypothetical protein
VAKGKKMGYVRLTRTRLRSGSHEVILGDKGMLPKVVKTKEAKRVGDRMNYLP